MAASLFRQLLATILRPATVTILVSQLLTVAVTFGPLDWAPWRRFGLGWRVWMELGSFNALFACAFLVAYFFLALLRRARGEELSNGIWRNVLLNSVTVTLLTLVPAVAAIH